MTASCARKAQEPTTLALFLSFKPQIDFNVKRYESYRERGKKGGAPKGNNNARKMPKEEESEETKQLETSKNNLKQAETSCEEVKQANEDIEQGKTTKNDLISISVSESINNNSVDVVDDNAHTRERENNRKFLDEFFKETNRAQIEVICMQLHTNPETLRSEARRSHSGMGTNGSHAQRLHRTGAALDKPTTDKIPFKSE